MGKPFFLLIIVHFISCIIPPYTLIKRNETLTFKLKTSDSSFYAYLPYEEDYEIGEELNPFIDHFFKIDIKIGFKQIFIKKNEEFPDESLFNKSSSEWDYDSHCLDVFENIKVKDYFKLEKDKDENYTSIFVFYIEEQYKDLFDPKEIFSISKVKFNSYLNETLIDTQLESKSINIYGFKIDYDISSKYLLYINAPISSIYENTVLNYKKNNSNINLFSYELDRDIRTFDNIILIVYNQNNYKQNIFIEYKNKIKDRFYNFIDLNGMDSYTIYSDESALFYVTNAQPGLYKISTNGQNYKYLFNDNFYDIKNLTDLKHIKHYKYTKEGFLYIQKNFFIFLIYAYSPSIYFKVEKIEIKEMEKEINIFNFEYFKISKGNSLNFNLNVSNQNVVLKLLSNNNGNVNINKNNYYFNEGEVKVINGVDKHFKIIAMDNNFTFAIKLKISDEFIEFPEFGKPYILPKNTYYKFLIYKINITNNSFLYFKVNETKKILLNYELTAEKNINEIDKGEIGIYMDNYVSLYLNHYKNIIPKENLYLFLYFENLTDNNITLETKYYKPIPFEEDKFTLFKVEDPYMNFYEEYKQESVFIIPCKGNIFTIFRYYLGFRGKEYYNPYKFSANGSFNDLLQIYSRDQAIGFINYYKLDINERDYSYIEEKNTKSILEPEYLIVKINETHFRLYIEEIFSDSPYINYTFVITPIENEYLLEPRCQFFNQFYLNEPPKMDNLEIIHFSNNFKINPDDKRLIYYIDLMPKKFKIYNKSQKYIYKLMGVTGPKQKYVKFYDSFYLSVCYKTCLRCDDIGNEQNHNCTVCLKGKLFQEDNGNCLDQCLTGYYKEENNCKKCHENCESCSKESENGNNNCLTCNKESKYKYLINIPELGKNCVEECPEGTILDREKYQCIKEENKNFIYICIGVAGGIILIFIIILITITLKKKRIKKEEENIMKEMNISSPLTVE